MQRRLIVMRHAKSSWISGAQTDHQRPLNKRGRRDAPRVATELVELGWTPNLVLSSDSQRTRETFLGMSVAFPESTDVRFLESFYHAGVNAVSDAIPQVSDDLNCVMVLGHNPGWEHLVYWLSGEEVIMKTATAALMTQEVPDWQSAMRTGTWSLEQVVYPRELHP